MTQPTVLIWDPIQDLDWNYEPERILLQRHGVRLVVPDTAKAGSGDLATADVVIVSGRIPPELLAEMPRCVGIICYSVGMDSVDAEAAAAAGITVTNVAGYCTDEVADHALALLLALQRRLYPFLMSAQAGDWNVYHGSDFAGIRRLRGQTAGIVGLGRIGSQVAQRCSAFGMSVIAYDPFVVAPEMPAVSMVELDVLLERSDAVILCGALTSSSRGLLDASRIGRMRPEAVVVNVARGALVDEQAIAEAVRNGRLAGAALDVRSEEPPGAGDPLVGIPNLLLTQHLAATSQEARDDLHAFAARRALELLVAGGRLTVEPV